MGLHVTMIDPVKRSSRFMTSHESSSLPEYREVNESLQRAGFRQCPAELHGFALGMAVTGLPEPLTIWRQEVYAEFDSDDVLANECRALLDRVFAAAVADAADDQASLSLFLPQDIVVDAQRLAAVRDWCQGFLFGFGLGGDTAGASLSPQTRELLNDFAEFTRLDTDDVENSEENQSALIEVEEYLREGVLLIRDELAEARRRATASTQ